MIVDASVAFKWIVVEVDSTTARGLLTPDRRFAAPSSLLAEIGHALTRHVRRGSLTRAAAHDAWSDFRTAPIEHRDASSVADAGLQLSLTLHANYYDCLYLALAITMDDLLVTADEKFVAAARSIPGLAARIALLGDDLRD